MQEQRETTLKPRSKRWRSSFLWTNSKQCKRGKEMTQARRRNLMLQHREKMNEKVRKMFTSQVFRFQFFTKNSFRVSKCIICDSSSFSC
jgi:hypothetical protein